jgi:hypothetical protein
MKWAVYEKTWGDNFVLNWDFYVLVEGDAPIGDPMLKGSWFFGSKDGDPTGKLRFGHARLLAASEAARLNAAKLDHKLQWTSEAKPHCLSHS